MFWFICVDDILPAPLCANPNRNSITCTTGRAVKSFFSSCRQQKFFISSTAAIPFCIKKQNTTFWISTTATAAIILCLREKTYRTLQCLDKNQAEVSNQILSNRLVSALPSVDIAFSKNNPFVELFDRSIFTSVANSEIIVLLISFPMAS